jgi:hypothetical protein
MWMLLLLGFLIHQPRRCLHQRIYQVPNLAWENPHLSLATLNQQPVTPDLDGQVLSHPSHTLRKGAILAEYLEFDCQGVCLPWTNEPIAGKAVLRLLSHKARVVIVGDVTRCGGSFPLAMGPKLLLPWMPQRHRASRSSQIIAEERRKDNPPSELPGSLLSD